MISSIYNTLFYGPLYNALIFLTAIIPGHDLGLAVVLLTVIVKLVLAPISHKTIQTQKKMKELEPSMSKIKEDHKADKQEQAMKIMELYREHNINPFSGVFLMFIQLPIILALFFVFKDGIDLSSVYIYDFVIKPPFIGTKLFGLLALGGKSIFLAVIVGLTQFIQTHLSLPPSPTGDKKSSEESFGDNLAKSMNFQIKFILPIFIAFVSYSLNTAVSVYWIVNNIFTIIHEFYVRKMAGKIISN